jgi:ribonuclease G
VKKIIINNNPWQTRIAIVIDDKLDSIYFESHDQNRLERAFFKGMVSKVLPGIQTAFVDIGQEKAGFLHISEIDRELAIEKISRHTQMDDSEDQPTPKRRPRQRIDISKILKEGEPLLVQVSKEPMYQKGAKLSTCFTLPGRFLVLMPNIPRLGVSKKIENREERIRLKNIVRENLPEGMGAIIRTTSEGRSADSILKDLYFLVKTWETIMQAYNAAKPEEKIYEDLDVVLQVVRDQLDENVEAVVIDDKKMQADIHKFVKIIAPELSHAIKLYQQPANIFVTYNIEKQIEQALEKKVPLRSGGSLIVETTEAMTVIDVNTGKFTGRSNLEDTILQTNLEASEEIARQLRLRNIGGLIVIDFIDMATPANRQKLFRTFEKIVKEHDKIQSVILKISEFGIVQMTRKRLGKTLAQQLTQTCCMCTGLGFVLSVQTECFALFRFLEQEFLSGRYSYSITVRINPTLFAYITHQEYNAILALEKIGGHKITFETDPSLLSGTYKVQKT